ncbi:lipase [Paenibacillus sp. BSR1-1]|uniref:esterase/lipase family protein n=1 Tax=Paenibacillus sp. BSR1-1 TaxID=3020845 RepID=UPI0025AF2955|nr:lipase [Paenibacillus sp. BSR1-1]MDN3016494.1 lipase [Paenibacillus sp. BSR1-1]
MRYILSSLFFCSLLMPAFSASAETSSTAESSGNEYPIVLVHGLTGWGRGELFGFKYWGGMNDLEQYLNNSGHRTYTAAVGPISSNWDRAVELYYYIKGGTVDYGAAHAKECGHARFGKTFPGLYSEWNGKNKIHLVGHSMGGQTIRTLTELLENGSESEQEYYKAHPEEGVSPLFEGGKHWVHSVTTLATPNNGSTYADAERVKTLVKSMVTDFAALSGAGGDNIVYDFKMDQWGLKRSPEESFLTYMDRVISSSVWTSKDISSYDLNTVGAAELNNWVKTQQDVYYFSYTGDASYIGLLTGHFYPLPTMTPLLWDSSLFIGSYSRTNPAPVIDKSWWQNDGIVNVKSSKFPFGQANKLFDGTIQRGVWNYFPVQYTWDHFDFVGLSEAHVIGIRQINDFYLNIANQLHGLPK